MKPNNRPPLLPAALLLAACTVTTDPLMTLSVSGTITQAGDPASAVVRLTAGNFSTNLPFDSAYAITVGGGAVPTSDCESAAIRAQLLAADGQTIVDEETRQLGACGQHVVDFEFP